MAIRGRGLLVLLLQPAILVACSSDGPAPVARPAPTPVRWLATLDATELHGAAVDLFGNLFVLAWERPSSTSDELIPSLARFAGDNGSWLWSTSFGSSPASPVTPWSLFFAENATLWVAGSADLTPGAGPIADGLVSPASAGDRFVSQIDPVAGSVLQTHALPRIFPIGLTADVDGGIFVSGTGSNERGSDLGMVRRIDANTGALSWEVFVDFDINSAIHDVDVDAAGGLCVGGVTSHEHATLGGRPLVPPSGTGGSAFVAYLARDTGAVQWTAVPAAREGTPRMAVRAAAGGGCDMAAATWSMRAGGGPAGAPTNRSPTDLTIVRYQPDGGELWRRTVVSHDYADPRAVVSSQAGDLLVFGHGLAVPALIDLGGGPVGGPGERGFGFGAQYAGVNGTHIWSQVFGATGEIKTSGDISYGPFVNPERAVAGRDGDLFVIGTFAGTAAFSDQTLDSPAGNAWDANVFIMATTR